MSLKFRAALTGFSLSTLLFVNVGNASIDWSPRGRCEQLFIKNSGHARDAARMIAFRLHRELHILLEPNAFQRPKFAVFFEGAERDMTLAVTHSVFPVLRMDGFSAARVEAADLFRNVEVDFHKTGARNTYPEFKVLAIDAVDFDAIGFTKYRDLRELLRARYEAGNSTILIVKGALTIMDDQERPQIDPEFEMLVDGAFTTSFRPNFFQFPGFR